MVHDFIPHKHYRQWSCEEALLWLEQSVKLPQYRKNFEELALDGIMIDFITDADLENDLNIKVRLHRIRIMEAIK